MADKPPTGTYGISHTRWATHGKPTDQNAHPHFDAERQTRARPQRRDRKLPGAQRSAAAGRRSHISPPKPTPRCWRILIGKIYDDSSSRRTAIRDLHKAGSSNAVRAALQQVIGTYGIALVHRDIPDFIVGARRGSPLVLGVGKDENFLASDVSAIVAYTRDAVYLNDFDVVAVERDKFEISSVAGEAGNYQISKVEFTDAKTSRRAITRTTCSRKSLSSRARCATRCAAGSARRMHRQARRVEHDAGAIARCRPRRSDRLRHRAARRA